MKMVTQLGIRTLMKEVVGILVQAGLYNWAMAEDFDDRNGNGVWDR